MHPLPPRRIARGFTHPSRRGHRLLSPGPLAPGCEPALHERRFAAKAILIRSPPIQAMERPRLSIGYLSIENITKNSAHQIERDQSLSGCRLAPIRRDVSRTPSEADFRPGRAARQ